MPEDEVFLEGAPFSSRIGVDEAERAEPQPLELELRFLRSVERAGARDEIVAATDYDSAWTLAREIIEPGPWRLIETLGTRLAYALLDKLPLDGVRVQLRKPQAMAHRQVTAAGLRLTRRPGPRVQAFIGIGGNLGERELILQTAIDNLRRETKVTAVSTLIETTPVGGPADQGDFLNGAIAIETTRPARALHGLLRHLEWRAGRVRGVPNGPRPLDLDLLSYGDAIIDCADLQVPHPRMRGRAFVLEPLAEIAPDWRHPQFQKSALALLEEKLPDMRPPRISGPQELR